MFASHVVELNRVAPDGSKQRDHWEAGAVAGNADALAKLTAPEYPDCVDYLWKWALELHGRSGVSMSGLAPLTYEAITAWAVLRKVWLTPSEVKALIDIDTALCAGAGEKKAEVAAADAEPTPQRAWPTRKPGVEPVLVRSED